MMKTLLLNAVYVFITTIVVFAPARADIIGIAVGTTASATPVGSSDDGTINFFIPLSGDGTTPVIYGAGGGTSSDRCVYGRDCGGGLLEMILYFNPVQMGPGVLSLLFTDLDIDEANDPWFFLETLQVLDAARGVIETIDYADLTGGSNRTTQLIELPITITSQPGYYVRLLMGTTFDFNGHDAYYYGNRFSNTEEHLLAKIVSVPEPSTLFLFGAGLLLMAAFGRRRRRVGVVLR